MTDRYVSFEATAAAYTDDAFLFTVNRHDIDSIAEELVPERNNIYPVTSKGRTPRRKLKGPLGWSGNIETLLYTTHAPTLLYYAMGANSTVVGVGAPNVHTLTPANTIPDFILEVGRDNAAHKYTGCAVTGFEISYEPDSAVTLNADVNARKEQPSGVLSSVTFSDFDAAERTFGGTEVDTRSGAAEGGAPTSVGYIESATITYDNNFTDDAYVLGSQFLSGLFINQITLNGSFEISFIDDTQYQEVIADTEKEFWFVTTQGVGVAARGYTIKLPRISYDSTNLPTNNAERYVQTLDWTANDDSAGNAIKIDISNGQSEAQFIA